MINEHGIRKYLQHKQIEFTEEPTGKEFLLKHCPYCHDKKQHFYISKEKGLFDCKKCQINGNFYKLQKHLGDVPGIMNIRDIVKEDYVVLEETKADGFHANLLTNKNALDYLRDRGINDKSIKKFKLGYENGWIAIPHYYQSKLANIKYRQFEGGKKFKREAGCRSVLFNADNLNRELSFVVIVDGELDAIKGSQEGIENIVGTTLGASSFSSEWISTLHGFSKIFICYDSDEVGQNGAKKVAEKLGLDRCKNIVLPVKDLNDYLLEYTIDDFKEILKTSKKFELSEITTLSSCLDKLKDYWEKRNDIIGVSTGYSDLDKILRGFRDEDLIIMSGISGVGKTTINLNFINDMLKKGHSILCYLLEGKLMYSIERLITIELGKPMTKITEKEIEDVKLKFSDYKLYFYTGPQSLLDTKQILEKTTLCCELYDIDLVIIDNLHKILDRSRDNQTAIVGKAVSDIKNLAVDLKIPIVLISHLKKMDNKKKIPGMDDLKDSSAIYQDSDVILMLWADREDDDIKKNVILRVVKNRSGEDLVDLSFIFDRDTGQFISMSLSEQ